MAPVFVIVKYLDSFESLHVDSGVTFQQLRALWQEKSGVDSRGLFFLMDNKSILPEEGILADVLPEGAFTFPIVVDSLFNIELSCCCLPHLRWTFSVGDLSTVADILADARKRLGILEEKEMRLFVNEQIVAADTKMKDLRQTAGPLKVEVDVEVSVKALIIRPKEFYDPIMDDGEPLLDEASGDVPAFEKDFDDRPVCRSCFLSDPAKLLMLDQERLLDQQRLLSVDLEESISSEKKIGNLIKEHELSDGCLFLFLELAMTIFVNNAVDDALQVVTVWPTGRLRVIRKNSGQSVLYNEKTLTDMNASFLELGLYHKSFVEIVELIQVTVHDVRDCLRDIEINRDMTFDNFVTLLHAEQRSPKYFITIDNNTTILSSTASLRSLGVHDGSEIKVWCESKWMKLLYNLEEAITDELNTASKFEDLLRVARSTFKTKLPNDTRFECLCGRIVSAESERRRRMPLACCHDTMSLRVIVPEKRTIKTSGTIQNLTCRLPRHCSVKAFKLIRKLVASRNESHRRKLEIHLCRAVLELLGATDIRLSVADTIDFAVQLTSGKRLELTATRDSRLVSFLSTLVTENYEREVMTFSIRGVHLTDEELERTFEEFRFRNGQILSVEPPYRPDRICQTMGGQQLDVAVQASTFYSSVCVQCSSSAGVSRAATIHPQRANFLIACMWERSLNFELSMPLLTSLRGSHLKAEILKTRPEVKSMKQITAIRRNDGAPIVKVTGDVFADEHGRKCAWEDVLSNSDQSSSIRLVDVQEEDYLLIPGDLRVVIRTYD